MYNNKLVELDPHGIVIGSGDTRDDRCTLCTIEKEPLNTQGAKENDSPLQDI